MTGSASGPVPRVYHWPLVRPWKLKHQHVPAAGLPLTRGQTVEIEASTHSCRGSTTDLWSDRGNWGINTFLPWVYHWPVVRPWKLKHQHVPAMGLPLTRGQTVEIEASTRSCHGSTTDPWSETVEIEASTRSCRGSTTDPWSDRGNWSINTFLPRVYHWPVVRPWKLKHQHVPAMGLPLTRGQRPWKLKHQHVPAAGLPLTLGQTVEIEASTRSCRGSTTDPWSDRGNWGINTFLPRVYHWPVVRPWKLRHQHVPAMGLPLTRGQTVEIEASTRSCHGSTTDPWSDRGNWSINTFLPWVYHWPVVRPWKLKHQHVPAMGLPLTHGQTVEIEASTRSCHGSTTDPWSDRGNWSINTFLPWVYHWPVVRPWKLKHQHVPAMGLPLTRGQTVEIEASTRSCHGSTTDPWSDRGNWSINTFLPRVYHWPVVRPWKLKRQHVPATGLPLNRG